MFKRKHQGSKLAQWVKAVAAKSDCLSFIFKTYVVSGKES